MRSLVILLALVCAVFASLEEDPQKWEEFKIKYGKTYRNPREEKFRYSIFRQTLQDIEDHNAQYEAGNETFKKGVNHFADMTTEEFVSILGHQRSNFSDLGIITSYENPVSVDVPASIDWRQKGAVSPVKNQGNCGCCWAFSVTGVLESFYYIRNRRMVQLSEQQLLDCAGYSCSGGDEGPALRYVQENGIETEQRYPYQGRQYNCRHDRSASAMYIKGYVQLRRGDENALLSAVGSLGPVSVAIDANEIKQYQSGVFSSPACSKDRTNHAVLAVGYGRDARTGVNYWIIKNSWGPNWGENGFFRLRRGTNECAISLDNVYPVLA